MLKSMTAFGRSFLETPFGHLCVEIKSVNRKFLDISLTIPREFSALEAEMRNLIASKIFRGKVEVLIQATFDQGAPVTVKPNLPLARQLKGAWEKMAEDLSLPNTFSLEFLKEEPEILLYEKNTEDEREYRSFLQKAVEGAVDDTLKMKVTEGETLYNDIFARIQFLEEGILRIEEKSAGATDKFREKLKERISEYIEESVQNDERLLKEIALFAEKVDIAEEITRFKSHLDQFREMIRSGEASIGKKLEFLVQELLREVNTVGSKASNGGVAHEVVAVKAEIEKIREQVQNVE